MVLFANTLIAITLLAFGVATLNQYWERDIDELMARTATRPLPTATPAMADNPLKGTLEEALKKAGCTGATVDVVNGKVTISGTVPEAKYTTCIQVVNQSGAVGIQNDLKKGK